MLSRRKISPKLTWNNRQKNRYRVADCVVSFHDHIKVTRRRPLVKLQERSAEHWRHLQCCSADRERRWRVASSAGVDHGLRKVAEFRSTCAWRFDRPATVRCRTVDCGRLGIIGCDEAVAAAVPEAPSIEERVERFCRSSKRPSHACR